MHFWYSPCHNQITSTTTYHVENFSHVRNRSYASLVLTDVSQSESSIHPPPLLITPQRMDELKRNEMFSISVRQNLLTAFRIHRYPEEGEIIRIVRNS